MKIWRRTGRVAASLALVGAGLVLGLAMAGAGAATGSVAQEAQPAAMTETGGSDSLPGMVPQGVFVDVAERVKPAVVFVESERPRSRSPHNLGRFEEFFDDFFGRDREDRDEGDTPDPRDFDTQTSQGSGVLVSPDGYILTNAHVVATRNDNRQAVEEAERVTVTLVDEQEYEAQIVGVDIATDVALLKIEGDDLPHVPLGNSDTLRVGEWVMAVGAPFGLQNTVSAGIVSALGRENLVTLGTVYNDFVQTDAAINPGNSGGPLVNLQGEIVGINTAIAANNGLMPSFSGVGFAVPVNMARYVMEQLQEHGKVVRGYLGVTVQPLTREHRLGFDIDPRLRGAIINSVTPGGPADEAGVEPFDIVVGLDGKPLRSQQDFLQRVAMIRPGEDVELQILRDGEEHEITVTLTERPASADFGVTPDTPRQRGGEEQREPQEPQESDAGESIGIRVVPLTPQFRERLGLDDGVAGVMIGAVRPGSPAAQSLLQRGDVIMRVGNTPITGIADFEAAMDEYEAGDYVGLVVQRAAGGPPQAIAVQTPR